MTTDLRYLRVAACSPRVSVADVPANVINICEAVEAAAAAGARVVVLPELCLTAYTCGDLFHNSTLIAGVSAGLADLLGRLSPDGPLVFAGIPVERGGTLYNCAVAIAGNRVAAVIPKTYLPDYNEFYEKRWFAPAPAATGLTVTLGGVEVPFGTDILLEAGGVRIAAEICEDLWAPVPPGFRASLAGAQVTVNLSASDDIVGKRAYLEALVAQQSARCLGAYVYSSAGVGESSTDLVFLGKGYVAENGVMLAGGLLEPGGMAVGDIDIAAIDRDRMHLRTFADCAAREVTVYYRVVPTGVDVPQTVSERPVDPHPFVPDNPATLAARCEDILTIQRAGLRRRLEAASCRSLVIGISGGLDSTLALLVAVRAFDEARLDRRGIVGVTMPGFGTTGRTRGNAVELMERLGVTAREVPVGPAVSLHFSDIGHDPAVHDVTYENSQARERTQILMDIANQTGGMVLGTGDLSELALGWATYNGDHMSMYGVNAGVPKTLVKHLVGYCADSMESVGDILRDIIMTPISPELIPADAEGNITQKTEDLVGPYELHDFFLYHTLRYGRRPRAIYALAMRAFAGQYDGATVARWLRTFFRRFFAQQFKRSCLPDGPKVGSVTLSPRGDWRMPSDASAALWLAECEGLC